MPLDNSPPLRTPHSHTASNPKLISIVICVGTLPIRVDSNQIPTPLKSRVEASWWICNNFENPIEQKLLVCLSFCKLCWIRLYEYVQIKKELCESDNYNQRYDLKANSKWFIYLSNTLPYSQVVGV